MASQLSIGVKVPTSQRADSVRPPLPSGYRWARTWQELLDGKAEERKFNNRTNEFEVVRKFNLQIAVVYDMTRFREVEKVCRRPVRKTQEYFCVLKDGTAWPAERLECYAVKEVEIDGE